MTWAAAIAEARRALREYVDQKIIGLFGFTLTTNTSAIGDEDQLAMADDDGNKGQRPARRIEPWGYRSRPPDKVRALWLRLGSSNVLFLGVASDKGYGDSDLDAGESELYCSKSGTRIRLGTDGAIHIDAASGADVIVNGSNLKVARDTDPVDLGTFIHQPASGTGVTPCQLSWVPPGGGTPTVIGSPIGSDLTGQISDGADHFKG
jgi:hypothetical protein